MATNIYFPKYSMAVRKFTNISISKYFCTSANIDVVVEVLWYRFT